MNIPALIDVVNENAVLITELIKEEILLVDTEHQLTFDNRLFALTMPAGYTTNVGAGCSYINGGPSIHGTVGSGTFTQP